MIARIKNRFFPQNNEQKVEELIQQIELIRKNHSTLVLFGSPTEGNWKGIANATVGLYPLNSLEIPQWYSNCTLRQKEVQIVLDRIIELKFEKVIISGFALYFYEFIDYLSRNINVDVLYHFTFAEAYRDEFQQSFQNVIAFCLEGKIKKIGFVKSDLAFLINKLYGVETYFQPLSEPNINIEIKEIPLDKSKFHIGVFGADTFNKNLHNQVINSLAVDNTIIHVLDKSKFKYLKMDDRIIEHGTNLSRDKFLSILSSMDLNLYMSYSESWGLIAKESEILGVKCLVNNSVDYYDNISIAINTIINERS